MTDKIMADEVIAQLQQLADKWRAEEQRLCRKADGQKSTYYAERLAAKADGIGTCADQLADLLSAMNVSEEKERTQSNHQVNDAFIAGWNAQEPSLEWKLEEGVHWLRLNGFPQHAILVDGATREEALHKLGDVLTHMFMDACPDPIVHADQQQAPEKENINEK